MKEKTSSFELLEPTRPEALVPDSWVEPWMMFTAAGLLVVFAAVFLILRKKKATAVDPLAARKAAYQEAGTALEKMKALQARDAAVQSSLILRKYLALAANDPALFETHEEFVSRHDSLKALNEDARRKSETGFTRLAALKYAAEIPDLKPSEVVNESRELLETLHHGFAA
ncbi:MAG: hypothetical protein ABIT37_22020 [Luteolibacter sp.]